MKCRKRRRKPGCTCEDFVNGNLTLNIVKDEEDDSIVLDVTAPSGFPTRLGVTRIFVPKLNAQVPWMATDGKHGSVIIRTTAPPAEHRYRMVGFCIPCKLKLMEYEGAA